MGSIQLPALHIQPPEDPLAQAGKVMQLKSMMQGEQMQKIQLQQAQQAQQDQQTVRKAFQDNNGDLDKTIASAAKAGVSPQMLTTLQTHALDVKTKTAQLTKDQLANMAQQNDNLVGLIQPVIDAPAEKKPVVYAQQRQQILQNPQAYGITDPSQIPPEQYPGDDALKSQLALHKGGKQQAEDALKQQKAAEEKAKAAAELPGQQAQSTEKQLSSAAQWMNGITDQATWTAGKSSLAKRGTPQDILDRIPDQYSPEAVHAVQQMGITPQQAANAPVDKEELADWLKKNPGKGPSDFMAYKAKLVPAFNFNLQQGGAGATAAPKAADGTPLTGEDLYKSFGTKGAMVKSIVEGRQTMPAGFALKSPYWQDVMNKVYQADPQFSEQRAQIRKALTTGKAGDNIGSLNTATVHLDALGEAAKALDNGSFTPGNAVYNSVAKIFGAKAPTDFASVKAAVAGEMANAMKGNATDIEIKTIGTALNDANSPKQLAGVVDHFLGLNFQKLNTYKERLEQQIPGDTAYSPILPSAQKVFAKHGIGDQPAVNTPAKTGGFDFSKFPKVNQ